MNTLSQLDAPILEGEPRQSAERELQYLLASPYFRSSKRCCAMLTYIVEHALTDPHSSVKERTIGVEVFGRVPDYDTTANPVVRATAGEIRKRLAQYAADHPHAAVLITLSSGSYLPTFHRRQDAAEPLVLFEPATRNEAPPSTELLGRPEALDILPAATDVPAPFSLHPATSRQHAFEAAAPSYRWALWLSAALFAACLGLTFALTRRQPAELRKDEPEGVLSVLASGPRTSIIVSDVNLQVYRSLFRKQVSLQDYVKHTYEQAANGAKAPIEKGAWEFILHQTETNVSSAIVAAELLRRLPNSNVVIQHPHDLSMRDLQSGNFVILGGPWINPWGQIFEDQLNFRILPPDQEPSKSEVHNIHPQPGEPSVYRSHRDVNYARIAVLPNLGKSGHVILVGATNADSLEAGGRFLASGESWAAILRHIGVDSVTKLPPLEIVLEVKGEQNVPLSMRVVAERAVTPTE